MNIDEEIKKLQCVKKLYEELSKNRKWFLYCLMKDFDGSSDEVKNIFNCWYLDIFNSLDEIRQEIEHNYNFYEIIELLIKFYKKETSD